MIRATWRFRASSRLCAGEMPCVVVASLGRTFIPPARLHIGQQPQESQCLVDIGLNKIIGMV